MTDELLPYYNEELRFIRKDAADFAEANPKIAGRLGMGTDSAEDPHVARMIEAFSYLNARIRHKLDDDFPEITESLLGILYPHYLAPVPSASIVEFTLDRGQAELTGGYRIGRHETLETEPARGDPTIEGEVCRFRTCYPVEIWPIEITGASLEHQPFTAPRVRFDQETLAVLRVQITPYVPTVTFSKMPIRRLRFFVRGQAPSNYRLYELLMTRLLGVTLVNSPTDEQPMILDRGCLRPVGFELDEGLLEYPARSFAGYRMLTEFFAFPEKFLFFDVDLPEGALRNIGNKLELFFHLAEERQDLERSVDIQTLCLGCTPIVNLYRQVAEPIRLSHTELEYRLVPDSRRPLAHEVFAIGRVTAVSPSRESVEFQPFYSTRHGLDVRRQRAFWKSARRPAPVRADMLDQGTEVFLSFVDLDFRPDLPLDWTIHVETTCLNRDLPRRLPFGGGQPRLQSVGEASLAKVTCITRPTRTLRPPLGQGTRWRLVSHLALNHLSLVDTEDGAAALREILRLYDFADSSQTRIMIDGLTSIKAERVTGRVVQRVSGKDSTFFCRGLDVQLSFDEDNFTDGSVLLFASVLERFLALYCSLNSFVKTTAVTNKRDGVLHRWPPRSGETVLL